MIGNLQPRFGEDALSTAISASMQRIHEPISAPVRIRKKNTKNLCVSRCFHQKKFGKYFHHQLFRNLFFIAEIFFYFQNFLSDLDMRETLKQVGGNESRGHQLEAQRFF